MGWVREGHPDHEGFAVGVVALEPGSSLFRELRFPWDDQPLGGIIALQAACDCGWRSSRFQPRDPAKWYPFAVALSERDDARARELWHEHVERQ